MKKSLPNIKPSELHIDLTQGAIRAEPGTVLWKLFDSGPAVPVKKSIEKKVGARK